jgi:hypothetical protein
MNLILHVGMERTGSTSIQMKLKSQFKELLNYGYFAFTESDFGSIDGNIIALPFNYTSKERFDDLSLFRNDTPNKIKILNEIDIKIKEAESFNCNSLVISSEFLSSRLSDIELENLLNDLIYKKFEKIKIVAYLRDPFSFIKSHRNQSIIRGGSNYIDLNCDYEYLNNFYLPIINLNKTIFKNENMNLDFFYYNNIKNIEDHFFRNILDVALINDINYIRHNESTSDIQINVLSHFLKNHILKTDFEYDKFRNFSDVLRHSIDINRFYKKTVDINLNNLLINNKNVENINNQLRNLFNIENFDIVYIVDYLNDNSLDLYNLIIPFFMSFNHYPQFKNILEDL